MERVYIALFLSWNCKFSCTTLRQPTTLPGWFSRFIALWRHTCKYLIIKNITLYTCNTFWSMVCRIFTTKLQCRNRICMFKKIIPSSISPLIACIQSSRLTFWRVFLGQLMGLAKEKADLVGHVFWQNVISAPLDSTENITRFILVS